MFSLSFSTSNAAFAESPDGEVASILHGICSQIQWGEQSGHIRDTNGNTIGEWSVTYD